MQWEEHQTEIFDVLFGNVSSAVTHQSVYYELFVADAGGGANIHGSCASWSTLLAGDMLTSSVVYSPLSIELSSSENLQGELDVVQCNNAEQTTGIVAALLASTPPPS